MTATLGIPLARRAALAQAQRAAVSVFLIRIAGAGMAYGTHILLARLMGKAEYGIYATVWVWITVFGHASLWGLGQATCRFVPHYRARGETDLARGFLAGGAVFTVLSGLAMAALGGTALWFGRNWVGEAYLWPFVLAVFVLPLLSLQDYVEGVARSFKWTGLAIAPPYILRQGGIAASMIACVVIGAPAEAWVAVACTLAAALMTLLIQISLLVYRIRGTLPAAPRAYRVREWAIASLPLAMYDLTLTGFNFVDVLLMGFFLPPEEVAIYFAATRILQFAVFASYSASAATAARFAETKASGDHASLRALVVRTARLTSGATVLIGAAVFLTAPLLLRMFGPGFEASLSPLSVLLVGIVVYSLFGPAEDVLNMLGGERLCAVMALAALSVAVILNVVLIPRYGIMGAAFAMATANIVRGAGLSFVARTRLGIPTHVLARSE